MKRLSQWWQTVLIVRENPSKICPHGDIFITRKKERQRELKRTSFSERDRETRERVLLKSQLTKEVFPSIKNGSRHLDALREKRNVKGNVTYNGT